MINRIRLYSEPQDESDPSTHPTNGSGEHRVSVTLGEILPALRDAILSSKAWVHDFADDRLEIPKDLYDVRKAYEQIRKAA